MPREAPDARDDLPKQALCQAALDQLQDEGSAMPDQAPGLEEPLLEPGQGAALDGQGQDKLECSPF